MKHRNQYSKPVKGITFKGKSRTKQSFKDECDVNQIMELYVKTGSVSHLNPLEPNYGFVPSDTFHESMNIVKDAEQAFADLPSRLREKFQTPGEFLEFVENPENVPEMRSLGLLEDTPDLPLVHAEQAATAAPVVSDDAKPSEASTSEP